jgi:hypothetical protein
MHHRSAREIEDRDRSTQRPVEVSALPPDHVAEGKINARGPEQDEHDIAAELDPLREGAADQGRRDDGEHHLEKHECLLRHSPGINRIRLPAHALQQKIREGVSDKGVAGCEGHAVAEYHPEGRHQSHQDQAVHHRRQHVLAANQAAIKKDQAGRGHHQDQRRADEHPGVVASIDLARDLMAGSQLLEPGQPLFHRRTVVRATGKHDRQEKKQDGREGKKNSEKAAKWLHKGRLMEQARRFASMNLQTRDEIMKERRHRQIKALRPIYNCRGESGNPTGFPKWKEAFP